MEILLAALVNAALTVLVTAPATALATYFFAVRQFKSQKTYEKRMDVLEAAYEKIKKTTGSYAYLNSPLRESGEPDYEEREKMFIERMNDLVDFLSAKRLFFSDAEKRIIDSIDMIIRDSWINHQERRFYERTHDEPKRARQIWMDNWKIASEQVPQLVKSLEETFRKALGL